MNGRISTLDLVENCIDHRLELLGRVNDRYQGIIRFLKAASKEKNNSSCIVEKSERLEIKSIEQLESTSKLSDTSRIESSSSDDVLPDYLGRILSTARETRAIEQNFKRKSIGSLLLSSSNQNTSIHSSKKIISKSSSAKSTDDHSRYHNPVKQITPQQSIKNSPRPSLQPRSLKNELLHRAQEKNQQKSSLHIKNEQELKPSKMKKNIPSKPPPPSIHEELERQVQILQQNQLQYKHPMEIVGHNKDLFLSQSKVLSNVARRPTAAPSILMDILSEYINNSNDMPSNNTSNENAHTPHRVHTSYTENHIKDSSNNHSNVDIQANSNNYNNSNNSDSVPMSIQISEPAPVDEMIPLSLSSRMNALTAMMRKERLAFERTLLPSLLKGAEITTANSNTSTNTSHNQQYQRQRQTQRRSLGYGLHAEEREAVIRSWLLTHRHMDLYEDMERMVSSRYNDQLSRRKYSLSQNISKNNISSDHYTPDKRTSTREDNSVECTQLVDDFVRNTPLCTPLDMRRLLRHVATSSTFNDNNNNNNNDNKDSTFISTSFRLSDEREQDWIQAELAIDRFHASFQSRTQFVIESTTGRITLRPVLRDLKSCSELEVLTKATVQSKQDIVFKRKKWIEALKAYRAMCILLQEKSQSLPPFYFVE